MIGRVLRRLSRHRLGLGAVLAVLAAATVGGLLQLEVDTGTESFLPAGDPAYQALEEKARSFGGDPIIVLLESHHPQQLLLDEHNLVKLLRLEGRLAKVPDVAAVYGPATVLNQTAGAAQNLLARISGSRDAVQNVAREKAEASGATARQAEAAAARAVRKFDRRYGALLVKALPTGLPTLRNQQFVANVLYDNNAKPRAQWKFVLPTDRTVALVVRPRQDLDQAASGRIVDAVRAAVRDSGLNLRKTTTTGAPALTSALTREAERELPVLGVAAVAAVGLVFLFAPWSKRRRSRLRPVITALSGTMVTLAAFGWLDHPVSLGVVAFLPILLGIGSDFPLYLSQPGTIRRPLTAGLAAAAGFASLALSPLPFVQELGIALGFGILSTMAVALVLRHLLGAVAPADVMARRSPAMWRRPRRWKRISLVTGAVAASAVGWAVLPNLAIESRPHELAKGLPELAAMQHVQDVLGSAGEVAVVLKGKDAVTPRSLQWGHDAQKAIVRAHGDAVRPIVTAPDLLRFLGKESTPDQVKAAVEVLPDYLTSAVINPDRTELVMIFGIGLQDLEQQRALLNGVRSVLPSPPDGLRAEVVGLPVAAVRGLDLVSDGRVLMNMAGIAIAGLVLLIGLRNRGDAGRALLTVLLATGWVLCFAWAVIGTLNPLTVAIGSLTTATGCEFAVMLAGAGRQRRHSLGWSVAIAALAGTAGYCVLAFSRVAVLAEFGLLLAAAVALSYLAALLVVRALPASPRPHARAASSPSDRVRKLPAPAKEVAV